ncbi:hypothetical protein CPC08DRAFT_632566 [Agrocybe pediades]|nr:hypothetical protein CPC08DRAFT_632566 [Agrocybe pediades]
MAAAPPPPPAATPGQPTPMQTDSSPVNATSNLSWEGDKMRVFNIYIYDYCVKRGFRRTAKELMDEARLPYDAVPPIDARQGLLFE